LSHIIGQQRGGSAKRNRAHPAGGASGPGEVSLECHAVGYRGNSTRTRNQSEPKSVGQSKNNYNFARNRVLACSHSACGWRSVKRRHKVFPKVVEPRIGVIRDRFDVRHANEGDVRKSGKHRVGERSRENSARAIK
jgi:hypothetical protein